MAKWRISVKIEMETLLEELEDNLCFSATHTGTIKRNNILISKWIYTVTLCWGTKNIISINITKCLLYKFLIIVCFKKHF